MACGLPVVASPVGVNSDIVQDGVTGILSTTHEHWARALEKLISSPALRLEMGRAGRGRAEESFSLAATAPRFVELLRLAARDVAPPGR
jgi:glycosyltransferase involved in cell wall biosynthesis